MKLAPPSATAPATIGTYTSAPLKHAEVLDGPSDVTVFATSTAPDLELTATLNLVDSTGAVTTLTTGDLLGSQRARRTSSTSRCYRCSSAYPRVTACKSC
jgi:predicted acyl esterase